MLPILSALGDLGGYYKSILPQRLGNHVAYRACFCDAPTKKMPKGFEGVCCRSGGVQDGT